MRRSCLALGNALCCALVVACSRGDGGSPPVAAPSVESPTEAASASADVPVGGVAGDCVVTYESLEEISRGAKAIVVVDVRSVRTEDLSLSTETSATLPFTYADVVVLESRAGDLAVGQTITVGELGGLTRGLNKETGELGEPQIMAPGGVMPLAMGKSYVLFLDGPGGIGPVKEGIYAPIGALQGKPVPADGKLALDGNGSVLASGDRTYEVARALDGRLWSEVRAEILAFMGKQ